jgi:hypothetical protein
MDWLWYKFDAIWVTFVITSRTIKFELLKLLYNSDCLDKISNDTQITQIWNKKIHKLNNMLVFFFYFLYFIECM